MSKNPNPGPPDPLPGAAVVRRVRERGLTDPRVLDALARLDRGRFLPPDLRRHADEDGPVAIGFDQTASQPFIVAVMTVELALTGTERVLEVGTGSGYQTAVLSSLAADVFTVERLTTLSLRARGLLDGLGRENVRYRVGDGSLGWPEHAPYDRVLVTAAVPGFPRALFDQLAEGGLLLAPVGDESDQVLTVVRKRDGQPATRRILPCRFVKLIGAEGWADEGA